MLLGMKLISLPANKNINKALLVNRLQVQGGANMTKHQFGGHMYTPFPVPSLLLQQGEQLPGTITIS